MIAPAAVLPTIARLGFDDGWLILGPHFLNFGLPSLLVDHRIAGDAGLGLETFGAHSPRDPWPWAPVQVCRADGHVSIWSRRSPVLIASRWFAEEPAALDGYDQVIAMVGDTHAVQLSWSALWTCRIGLAHLNTPHGRPCGRPRILRGGVTTLASIQGPKHQRR